MFARYHGKREMNSEERRSDVARRGRIVNDGF
jgi:hypothetical protein